MSYTAGPDARAGTEERERERLRAKIKKRGTKRHMEI